MKNQLLKFVLKFVLFVLLVLIVDRGVGHAFVAIKDVALEKNPNNTSLMTSYIIEKCSSDVIIIGSSKASHHYVPQMLEDSLNLSIYNCGQDGCFFLYQNCILNMILDRYKPNIIIWDIQPRCFMDPDMISEYQSKRNLAPYYSNSKWVKSYIDSESKLSQLKMTVKSYVYNSKFHNYFLQPFISKGINSMNGYIPLPNSGYDYPSLNINHEENYGYYPDNWKYILLKNTVQRCIKEGVNLQIYISPEYTYKSSLFETTVNDIKETIELSHFYDYSSDGTLLSSPKYFRDESHLNDKGARVFTEKLIKERLLLAE